jgi:predicted alpha/beta superfamily hydrolase
MAGVATTVAGAPGRQAVCCLPAMSSARSARARRSGPPAGTSPLPAWAGRLTRFRVESSIPGIEGRDVTILSPVPAALAEHAAFGAAAGGAPGNYPVLYLHDGQNCLARNVFGAPGWSAHAVAAELAAAGRMAPTIVVMVDNAGGSEGRRREFVPEAGEPGGQTADGYLDFLEADVIPFVERWYPALPGPADRCIGGSSYGGLISLYAGWTRPRTWTRVLCMSPAFHWDFHRLVRETRERPALRLYLDSGTTDYEGSDDGQAETEALRDLLVERGFVPGVDLVHEVGHGDTHDEAAWCRRLPLALPFLFPAGGARRR